MNQYKKLGSAEREELSSNYLIDSWSYSAVSTFARNEKDFERSYIWRERGLRSASSIGGNAYHEALEEYFKNFGGNKLDLVECEIIAFKYIDNVSANKWKLQKTTPTIEDCKKKANKIATECLKNFFSEISIYIDEIDEILGVETYIDTYLTINGVDIPLPCHMKLDLIVRLKNGKIALIDHKSKMKHSDEKEAAMVIGKQAITYCKGFEEQTGKTVDEVWFMENKYSQNRDGSPQINVIRVVMDSDTRKLYEALLYEPLKRLISAVSDPDYVYLINESDNFVDKAELFDFWAKTQIGEIDDFDIPDNKKDLMERRLKKIRDASLGSINPKIIRDFKKNASAFITYDLSNKNMSNTEKIEHRLRSFKIPARIEKKFEGFSSDTYLLEISAGTSFKSVYKHRLDIANALGVESVRMPQNLFKYGDKSYFVIEAAKKRTKELLFDPSFQEGSKIPVGVNNFAETVFWDLDNAATTHALVCGATGSGKSVWLKSTIEYAKLAGVENFVIFDPKFDERLQVYKKEPNFEVYNTIEECEIKLEELVKEMNHRVKNGIVKKTMIIFDEYADAIESCRTGNALKNYEMKEVGCFANGNPKMKQVHTSTDKSLPENLKLLLQKSRSCGMRIIAATQRASTETIKGDVKVNLAVKICLYVPKETDSRVVLDESGAELLSGNGDGLMSSPEYPSLMRFQGFYIE